MDQPLFTPTTVVIKPEPGDKRKQPETAHVHETQNDLRLRPAHAWDDSTSVSAKKIKVENGENVVDEMTEVVEGECDADQSIFEKGLVNLPTGWSSDDLRSYLTHNGIHYKSAKKEKGMVVGFVYFETTEQVNNAFKDLGGKSCGNQNLRIVDVEPFVRLPRSTQHTTSENLEIFKSLGHVDGSDSVNDNLTLCSTVVKSRSARDVVTPLAYMSYVDQLEHKKSNLSLMLKKLTQNVRKACPNGVTLPEWIVNSKELGGLPCKLEGIIESPLVNGYRNKCEFSVGYSIKGKVTVGFFLGNFREGVTAVEEPLNCPNVSEIACKYAAIFQESLQHSALPIWNKLNNTGFWRQLTVREGRIPGKNSEVEYHEAHIAEVLLMVQVSSTGFDNRLVNNEIERMGKAFNTGVSANSPLLPLNALLVQDNTGISNIAPVDAPLRSLPIRNDENVNGFESAKDVAQARIHDYISNLRFCISATACFQVNTLAAEKLYSLAGDWAGLGPDTLLFDICCGTGTIGLMLAHRVGMVVGIEMNTSAVSDAILNAEINGIQNCRFVCSKAEDVIESLLKEYLDTPSKPVEIPKGSVMNDEIVSVIDETVNPIENASGPEERVGIELENHEAASKCNRFGGLESNSCQSFSAEFGIPMQQFKNVVAIVDPPRGGLHPIVIKALRTQPLLQRLVYISCNAESLVANATELCSPSVDKTEKGNKNNRGWRNMSNAGLARHQVKSIPNLEPFRPIKAMAVDLFPHTPRCELVMLLERKIVMGDKCQENDNLYGSGEKYKSWAVEESNELLKLMVDAANRGWRDSNGLFTKITVEKNILPVLNKNLGCRITYAQYQSRLKWFKTRYANYSNLMGFNSAVGWDSITKKFTAPSQVWEEYFKLHPSHTSYLTHTAGDYEDLRIAVGNGVIRRHPTGDDKEEGKGHRSLENSIYNYDNAKFTKNGTQDRSTLPSRPINSEVPPAPKRSGRNDIKDKPTLETNANQLDDITHISRSIEKLAEAVKSFDIARYSCWNLIKEVPDLDKRARFKALNLLNTIAKKIEFIKMTPEERYDWITYELGET